MHESNMPEQSTLTFVLIIILREYVFLDWHVLVNLGLTEKDFGLVMVIKYTV